ncbi:MAG TPA: glycosyltransferase family 9 protein [Patescibacteria group bacterium]|nr:glycosyltransferase family 9 protein [Patescibacteria group bacterium]
MQQRILVIKLSALGDFIVALGSMAAIRRAHPGAHITLLTTRLFVDLAQRSGYFNEIIVDSRPKIYNVAGWLYLFKMLNRAPFDRVYDLQLNDRSAVYYRMMLKKPEWSGVVKGASHFYTNPEWRQMHAFQRHKAMLAELGMEVTIPDLSWMTSDISLFAPPKPYVLLIPGSAPRWPQKRWPALRYGALAMRLMREGYNVAVLGTAAEQEVIERVLKSAPGVIDLSGRTSLYDIATLARGAAGAVGNDTGPSHLVAMAGCPLVTLFSGVSHPELSSPVGDAVTIIQSDNLADISVDDVMKNFHPRGAA